MTAALTRQQQDDLRSCEKVISRGINTFRAVGAALAKIRDDKLYKAEYKTFESYCNTRWGFGKSQAYRLIEAAGAPETSPAGDKIETERQARKYLAEQRKPKSEHRPLCSVCEVRPRAAGQDRCQFCIDVNRQPYGEIGTDGVFRKAADRKVAPVDTTAPAVATVDDELVVEAPKPHVTNNTGCVEWYTPDTVLDAVRSVLGTIELDPASCQVAQQRVQAERFYTADDDGLSQSWSGKVFCNPPYTNGTVKKFTDKLVGHVQSGAVSEAILLVNNATDTAWFQAAAAASSAICFPSGRIRFVSPEGEQNSPLQGQAILYFGRNPRAFREAFSQFGIVFANPPQTAINSVTQVLDSIRKDMGDKFTNPKTDRDHLMFFLDRNVRRILAA